MKKIIILVLILNHLLLSSQKVEIAQTKNFEKTEIDNIKPLTRKGAVFAFWGWNNAVYSNSDIHFKGNGYDFQLNDVRAKDRQTQFKFGTYFNPGKLTIPQTNARIGYFIKDNVAIILGLDHMKYVMVQDQKVNFSGHIGDPNYSNYVQNGQVDLSDGEFLTFEHTDGLNYVHIGVEKYKNIIDKKNFDIIGAYGIGGGFLLPKTNAKLFGFERSDRFHLAGFGTDIRASLNIVLYNHIMLRVEGKYGYINMSDIKTTLNNKPDKASQDFVFGQLNFGIGYIFNTRKM